MEQERPATSMKGKNGTRKRARQIIAKQKDNEIVHKQFAIDKSQRMNRTKQKKNRKRNETKGKMKNLQNCNFGKLQTER